MLSLVAWILQQWTSLPGRWNLAVHTKHGQGNGFFVKRRTGLFWEPNLLLPLLPGEGGGQRRRSCYLLLEAACCLRQTVVPRGVPVEEAVQWSEGLGEPCLPASTLGPSVLSEQSQITDVGFTSWWWKGEERNGFPVIVISKIIIDSINPLILSKCLVSAKHFIHEYRPGPWGLASVVIFQLHKS